jgi:hypothetical protein
MKLLSLAARSRRDAFTMSVLTTCGVGSGVACDASHSWYERMATETDVDGYAG